MVVRVLLQQAASASLQLPPEDGAEGEVRTVGGSAPGQATVCFVCFLKEATEEAVRKAARAVMSVRLTEPEAGGRRTSLAAGPGEVLVVPQATLGGRLKGSGVQYHGNIEPAAGGELYRLFLGELEGGLGRDRVRAGRYGARQLLSTVTTGPYSHAFDIQ
jgi:D-Tyr-tRNAtyr deacylase